MPRKPAAKLLLYLRGLVVSYLGVESRDQHEGSGHHLSDAVSAGIEQRHGNSVLHDASSIACVGTEN